MDMTEGRKRFPIFPCHFPHGVTESQLEVIVERLTDRCDAVFLGSDATQAEYDAWQRALCAWAEETRKAHCR